MAYVLLYSGMLSKSRPDYRVGMEQIRDRIQAALPDAMVKLNVSNSGKGDGDEHWRDEADKIIEMHNAGTLPKPLVVGGHSMGGRAVLLIAEKIKDHGINVDYLISIDLTLGVNPKAGNNIKWYHDFWAGLNKVRRADDYDGEWQRFDLDEIEGRNVHHVEAAEIEFTQANIVNTVYAMADTPDLPQPGEPWDNSIDTQCAMEITGHEGIVKEAYKDSVGVWTWSIGITSASGHSVERYIDNPQTVERCLEVFIWMLDTSFADDVRETFEGYPLTKEQFTAALSFHWNTGGIEKALWVDSFKAGNMELSKQQFMNWSSPPEIIPRREKERDLFFDGKWSQDPRVATIWPVMKPSYRPDFGNGEAVDIFDDMTTVIEKHNDGGEPPVDPPDEIDVEAIKEQLEVIRSSCDLIESELPEG